MRRKLLLKLVSILGLFDLLTDGIDGDSTFIGVATPDPGFLFGLRLPKHVPLQLLDPPFLQLVLVQLGHVVPLLFVFHHISWFFKPRLF